MERLIRYLFLEQPQQKLKLAALIPDDEQWREVEGVLDSYFRTNKLTGVMTKAGKVHLPRRERRRLEMLAKEGNGDA